MKNELLYLLKIQVQEIFRTKKLFVLIYSCIILFSSILYMQDFSMKITANLILTVWISLMMFLGINTFTKEERESLFVLSNTPLSSKYFKLILSQCVLNFPIFLALAIQIFFESENVLLSLSWAVLTYIFAIMLGMFLGNTVSKFYGLAILLAILAYNFFFVNPYRQMEYSFVFGINEYLFNIEQLHFISLYKMVGIIILGLISIAIRKKYFYLNTSKYVPLILFMIGFILVESALFGFYQIGKTSVPKNMKIQDREIICINVEAKEFMQGVKLLANIQNAYIPFGASTVKKYELRKEFLSSVAWKFIKQEKQLTLDGDKLRVNIYSLATLNFNNPSMVMNACDDFANFWILSIPKYSKGNRYFRHILDGAGEVIKRNAVYNTFGESKSFDKANKVIDFLLDAPITRDNYVKRIGLLVASQHQDKLLGLVRELEQLNLKTDKEFAVCLNEKFPEIYQDPYIHKILERIIQGEK